MTNPNPNRQRDHQANERTFLAWLRTAVALIAFGFAIARFGLFTRQLQSVLQTGAVVAHPILNSQTLGLVFVLFGIGLILIAAWRYNEVLQQIERGDFRPARWLVWLMTVVVVALGVLSIPLLVGREPLPSRKEPPGAPQNLDP